MLHSSARNLSLHARDCLGFPGPSSNPAVVLPKWGTCNNGPKFLQPCANHGMSSPVRLPRVVTTPSGSNLGTNCNETSRARQEMSCVLNACLHHELPRIVKLYKQLERSTKSLRERLKDKAAHLICWEHVEGRSKDGEVPERLSMLNGCNLLHAQGKGWESWPLAALQEVARQSWSTVR